MQRWFLRLPSKLLEPLTLDDIEDICTEDAQAIRQFINSRLGNKTYLFLIINQSIHLIVYSFIDYLFVNNNNIIIIWCGGRYRELFRWLIALGADVAAHQVSNKMNAKNMGISSSLHLIISFFISSPLLLFSLLFFFSFFSVYWFFLLSNRFWTSLIRDRSIAHPPKNNNDCSNINWRLHSFWSPSSCQQ